VQVKRKRFGGLFQTLQIRNKQCKTAGSGGLKFIKVKFIFLAPADAVEKKSDGFIQKHEQKKTLLCRYCTSYLLSARSLPPKPVNRLGAGAGCG
jgi:hypothetical protein